MTDPLQIGKHTLGPGPGPDEEGDTRVDVDIKEIAGEVTCKHGAKPVEKAQA